MDSFGMEFKTFPKTFSSTKLFSLNKRCRFHCDNKAQKKLIRFAIDILISTNKPARKKVRFELLSRMPNRRNQIEKKTSPSLPYLLNVKITFELIYLLSSERMKQKNIWNRSAFQATDVYSLTDWRGGQSLNELHAKTMS